MFANADVVTMDERHPLAEAVAVRSGRILAVGDLEGVLAAAGRSAHVVDLGGLTLIPGFVDGHGHFTQVASELDWVDLAPPPATRATCTRSPQAIDARRPLSTQSSASPLSRRTA